MSTLVVSNISDGTDTVGSNYVTNGSAKAWCWVDDATPSSPAIQNSLNCSSVTYVGTGSYTYSLTNGFANRYGASTGFSLRNSIPIASSSSGVSMPDTSTVRVQTRTDTGSSSDAAFTSTVFGDLA